jgi:chromosome segregation ATPase
MEIGATIGLVLAMIGGIATVIKVISDKKESREKRKNLSANSYQTWVDTASKLTENNLSLRETVDGLIDENKSLRKRLRSLEDERESRIAHVEDELKQIRQIYEIRIKNMESKHEKALDRISLLENENNKFLARIKTLETENERLRSLVQELEISKENKHNGI